MAPIDTTRYDFIVSLEENATISQIVEERVNSWLDIEGIEPEGEDTSFSLALCIEVFNLVFFFFGNGIEAGVGVEEVGNESEVEFGVSGDERGWR